MNFPFNLKGDIMPIAKSKSGDYKRIEQVAQELGIEVATLDSDNGWQLTTKDAHIFFATNVEDLIDIMRSADARNRKRVVQYFYFCSKPKMALITQNTIEGGKQNMGQGTVKESGGLRAYSIIRYKGAPHIILSYIHERPRRVRIAPWRYGVHEYRIREHYRDIYEEKSFVVFVERMAECEVLLAW